MKYQLYTNASKKIDVENLGAMLNTSIKFILCRDILIKRSVIKL